MSTTVGSAKSDALLNDVFSGYDPTGGQAIAPGPATIALSAEHLPSSATYSLAADEVTVNEDGAYELTFGVTLTVATNARTQGQAWLEMNGSEVAGTRVMLYCRQANHGATGSAQVFMNLTDGDVLRIRAQRTAGAGSLTTLANGARLALRRL